MKTPEAIAKEIWEEVGEVVALANTNGEIRAAKAIFERYIQAERDSRLPSREEFGKWVTELYKTERMQPSPNECYDWLRDNMQANTERPEVSDFALQRRAIEIAILMGAGKTKTEVLRNGTWQLVVAGFRAALAREGKMSFKLKRTYTDVHGVQRTLIWKEDLDGLVCYRKNENGETICSAASRWITEDGSVIQIPWEAWDYTGIAFKEEYIYE